MPSVTPYEITILAAGVQRTLFAQTEREAALMAKSVLRRFEGQPALISFWIDASDRGALKRLGTYLGSVLAEMTGTSEVVVLPAVYPCLAHLRLPWLRRVLAESKRETHANHRVGTDG